MTRIRSVLLALALIFSPVIISIILGRGQFCDDKENIFTCTREWVVAIGPLAGLLAAMIAAYYVYKQLIELKKQNKMVRASQLMVNLNFQSERLSLLTREFSPGNQRTNHFNIVKFDGDYCAYWVRLQMDRLQQRYLPPGSTPTFPAMKKFVSALCDVADRKEACWNDLQQIKMKEFELGEGGWADQGAGPVLQHNAAMSESFKNKLDDYIRIESEFVLRYHELWEEAENISEYISKNISDIHNQLLNLPLAEFES